MRKAFYRPPLVRLVDNLYCYRYLKIIRLEYACMLYIINYITLSRCGLSYRNWIVKVEMKKSNGSDKEEAEEYRQLNYTGTVYKRCVSV